ncbi:hypothetical protein [Desulfovibrio sp.]
MSTAMERILTLELPPEAGFLSVAVAAAEAAGRAFGLSEARAPRLALAVEEFFEYLRREARRDEPLRLTLRRLGPAARAEFRFRAEHLDLRALNYAAGVAPGDGGEMGLVLAARFTDRCRLTLSGKDDVMLAAEVDREYPAADPLREPPRLAPPFRLVEDPAAEMLRHAAMLAAGRYPARLCPKGFFNPGRLADMAEAGLYSALAVADSGGRPAGLLLWRSPGGQGVLFSGPYVLDPAHGREVAVMLTEGFLARVARTKALCAVSERPTADLPAEFFEPLGSLFFTAGGEVAEQAAFFRSLREDEGAAVWAHPDLRPFLEREYGRLAFMRDLLPPDPGDGLEREHSLLSTELDQRRGLAVLRPLLGGRDLAENLGRHVEALRREGIPDILFYLDLAWPWQAAMTPALLSAGFTPRLLLPHSGVSDEAVFEHDPQPH